MTVGGKVATTQTLPVLLFVHLTVFLATKACTESNLKGRKHKLCCITLKFKSKTSARHLPSCIHTHTMSCFWH
jgi:hypothetical protein